MEKLMIKINPEKALAVKRARLLPLTKRQFNLYMFDHKLTQTVDAVFSEHQREKIEFDGAGKIERNSPTTLAIMMALGWTDEQVDQMWEHALTL